MSAQISKWTTSARFCRILPILKYVWAENGNFRKTRKNRDFRHFGHQITYRSHNRPLEFLRHFRDLAHIQYPKCRKSFFFRFAEKCIISAPSYFKMGKIRQNLADVVHFKVWAFLAKTALFLTFQVVSAENALYKLNLCVFGCQDNANLLKSSFSIFIYVFTLHFEVWINILHITAHFQLKLLEMWEKVLFLWGTLTFHFKPDQRSTAETRASQKDII